MGGYAFFGEGGQRYWSLNLSGAIVWWGLLEELSGDRLEEAVLEEHNFGHVFRADAYRPLARDCLDYLSSEKPLPEGTEDYRQRQGAPLARFKKDALDVFKDSLKRLPSGGKFYALDNMDTEWWEDPCDCEVCKKEGRWEEVRAWYFS